MLLKDIALAATRVNVEVNKAGLVDILGDAGETNVQGEDVKKLDIFANNQFIGVTRHGVTCAGVASEENDEIIVFDDPLSNNSKYVMLMDPLDGSGNIDVNVSIGTIFSIYKRVSEKGHLLLSMIFYNPAGNR
jgi:fructose-1,6-bisphosphatase I